jgi:ATP-dependent exoDNAse (exonuclease V) beta subunit
MTNTLELVRAGAGSGKTTDLCRIVDVAVAAGLDPARILATTFTKKAAAELKGRMQAKLLAGAADRRVAGRNAERLELAAIGTVHSVAHRLLSRYALELGLSPRLEVVTESASELAMGHLLGALPSAAWPQLTELADRLGLDDLPQRLLGLLAAKRGNRIADDEFARQMAASAERLCELLAPGGAMPEAPPLGRLHALAEAALSALNALGDDTQTTAKARQKLRQLKSKNLPLWGSYLEAIKLTAGKRSGADALLDPLRNHAADVGRNPQLLADVRLFSQLLAGETNRLDAEYRRYKSERGLVDYTDLEILLLRLLDDPALATRLGEDFDLLLVDEFQDTNPLQLAIFQRLRRISPRSRWVGDPKQAIYGFRDTDPKLVNDLWHGTAGATREELPCNFRSQRGLVQFVGTGFAPLLGEEARQQPTQPGAPKGLERWVLHTENQAEDATALAGGIAQLIQEGFLPGKIAVLERTNRLLTPLAVALEDFGIPCLLESPGLLSTREGALVLAGLRLVADRHDSLAAATLIHLLGDPGQATPAWLEVRLREVMAARRDEETGRGQPWAGEPRLAQLEKIDRRLLSPAQIVPQIFEALRLPNLVAQWRDPARRCANLDSLLRHSREYEESALEAGEAVTLNGLILHLEHLEAEGLDVCYPPQGHDAVTLTTYHSAKGLEWPVVVLSGLDSARSPDLWSPVVTGGGGTEADPLAGRTVRAWTWPFGQTDGMFGGLRKGSGLEDRALTSAEGQERAAREADENLRLLYVGCTRAKQKLVFAHRDGKYAWLARLSAVDSLLPCDLGEGEHSLDGIETTFVLRRLDCAQAENRRVVSAEKQRWLALNTIAQPPELMPRFHSPSQAAAGAVSVPLRCEELPGPSYFPAGSDEIRFNLLGDAVHAYCAALPSLQFLDERAKEAVAARCLAAFSVSGMIAATAVVAAGNRFAEWVSTRFPGARWSTEMTATGPRRAGGRWHGTVDLVLRLASGGVVIVDHKSAPIRRDQCQAKAAQFTGQLAAYREVLASAATPVAGTWIHFPLAGVMVEFQ